MNIIEAWKKNKERKPMKSALGIVHKWEKIEYFVLDCGPSEFLGDWEIIDKEKKTLTVEVKLRKRLEGGYLLYHTEYDENGKEIWPDRWGVNPIAVGSATFELEE